MDEGKGKKKEKKNHEAINKSKMRSRKIVEE